MIPTRGYAVNGPEAKFEPFDFERRDVGAHDILIEILYCGICHSDIHQAKGEWGNSLYPMVPGHEIVGRVAQVGSEVTKFKEGDIAGVGCFVDSCRTCKNCADGFEQFCQKHLVMTYNGTEKDEKTLTFGGYSNQVVVDENYALRVSPDQPLANVAPLLCAGITTYSPLKRFNVGPGKKVGIIGLGGLGHMGVKIAASMGAEVTVFSTSPSKEQDARNLGAHNFVVTKNPENLAPLAGTYDFILDTVSAPHDLNMYLNLLGREGVLALVGVPEKPAEVYAFPLLTNNRSLAGSMIGGISETQEMLDYCAAHNITSDVEVIPIQQIEEAYERTIKADVRYRFVIDMQSLQQPA
jgi:alcohol dehydrogenase (NADP+)